MALIQALFSFLGKSAGKVLNAIFGWAVIALFGRSSPREQTLLTGLVAMAAMWPLLLVGIVAPKAAAFLVAFVPLSRSVPEGVIRAIWMALAAIVPITVGFVVAAKSPAAKDDPFPKRVLSGVPITLGLASAFLVMFVTVPALRIVSILRGWADEHVPLITEGDEYAGAAARVEDRIQANELEARRSAIPWWMSVPSGILRATGGAAIRGFMPEELAYWSGPNLQVALYPSDILVRGAKRKAAWTHGLLAESFARGPGLQTFDPDAQEIERQVHRAWRVYEENPDAHAESKVLKARVEEMARDLSSLDVSYDQWQIAYRKIAQLARALERKPQLLESAVTAEGGIMHTEQNRERARKEAPNPRPLESAPTGDLLKQLFRQTGDLLKKEMELAKAEIRGTVRSVATMTIGFVVAAVFAILGIGFLGAAAVLALASRIPAWESALIVGFAMIVVGAIVGFAAKSKGAEKPLERTKKTLKEDVQWAKERMA